MSLNGLEAVEVNEAYQSALGEGGGWLLLKYITRDEVGLSGHGNGGLPEVQEAISRYEEQSPLFGFIQYRRRKVLLKYVAEGTSRLLQARVTVHFRSVTEKFTPHDTIFSFVKLAELHESALSSACSLHTATASTKSSNDSITQRGLAGISEDVSESLVDDAKERGSVEKPQRTSLPRQMSEESQTRCEKVNENASAKKSPPNTAQSSLKRARTVSNVDKALPPIPGDTKTESAVNGRLLGEETDPRSLLDSSNYETRPSVERRTSSQSARPSTRDMYDAYGYRQKVKLGPRPSTDSVGRPDTMDQTNDFRPVSTLPAGLRMPFRKATPQKTVHIRPQSQQSQRTFPSLQLQRERPSAGPVTPIQIPDRKTAIVSNGLLTPAKTPADARSPKITPEKRRLMKALQLRQKQLAMQKSPNSLGIEDIPSEPEHVKPELDESILSAITDASDPQADPDLVHVSIHDLSKEPSNVEASPISILEISDGPSTQASSVSEEEENTVQNKQGSAPKENPAPSYIDNALPEIIGEDLLRGSPEGNEMVLHQMAGESDQSSKDPAPFNPSIVTQAHQPVHLLYTAEQLGLQEDDQISSPATNVLHITPNSSVTVGKTVPLKDSGKDAEMTVKNGLAENTEKSLPTSSLDDLSATMIDAINVTGKNALRMTEPHGEVVMLERQPSKDTEDASTETADIFVADISNREQATFQSIPVRSLGQSLDQHAGKSAAPILGEDRKAINVANEQYSSSYKPVDRSDPLEVPLPPIDDAEEASLSPYEINHQARPMSQSSNPQTESHPLLSQVERQSQEKDLTAIRPSTFDTFSEQQAERQIRRRGAVNPPKRVSSSEHSDEQFLSDDLFMEELKMATLQEAKPISVSKSPVKPVFSRSDSEQQLAETTKGIRSVSSPVEQLSKDEEAFTLPQLSKPPAPRSFSANQSLRPDSLPTPAPIPKKIGVSSGISQRIKALEQLSSRPTSPQSVAPSNASILVTQRKTSFRSPPRMSDHSGNPNNESRPNSTYHSPSPSPVAVKSNPFNNLNKAGYAPPESISVTATIVRDAKNKTPEMPVDPSEPRAMDLHQSPLVVQHQKMAPPPLPPLKPPRPPFARYSSARSGSSSSTEQRAEAPQNTRRDSFASILSRSSRAGSEAELPRSLSESSLSGIANRAENREEKKDSKRSRLMKRMSSISSVSRKSIANALSPNPKEAPIIEHQEPVVETPSATVDVGDINVQFPDTLLWKRRHMIIDEQGILILSASQSDSNSKVITKKFPLSEFRPPYIPDQDRQELPNSVILDFKDGSTLQCACEHPQGQAVVLQVLLEAHSLHQSQ